MALFFVLNHHVEPMLWAHTSQNPAQLGVLFDQRLHEKHIFLVQLHPAANHGLCDLHCVLVDDSLVFYLRMVHFKCSGQGMHVDYGQEYFRLGESLLKPDQVVNGAKIVPNSQVACGLHPCHDADMRQ